MVRARGEASGSCARCGRRGHRDGDRRRPGRGQAREARGRGAQEPVEQDGGLADRRVAGRLQGRRRDGENGRPALQARHGPCREGRGGPFRQRRRRRAHRLRGRRCAQRHRAGLPVRQDHPRRQVHLRPAVGGHDQVHLHAAPGDDEGQDRRQRRRRLRAPEGHDAVRMDGVLLCDKPAGLTSHDVDVRLRRALREATGEKARVGHAGTLDPFATGLLVLLVGRATRVQRFLLALPKTYEFVARFGAVSTTGDPDGEIVETGVVPEGDLELPVGEGGGPGVARNVRGGGGPRPPPIYSAVRIAGRRAFTYAHRGEEVEMPERTVRVYRFEELWREADRRGFVVECSSGTYIRSLVTELGDAYCETLRRTAIGPFRIEDAGGPEDLARTQPLEAAVGFLPRLELEGEEARMAAHGRAVPGEGDGPTLLVDAEGPIAIAEPAQDGTLKPIVGFRG